MIELISRIPSQSIDMKQEQFKIIKEQILWEKLNHINITDNP